MTEVASAYVTLLPSAKGFGPSLSRSIGGDLDRAGKLGGEQYTRGISGVVSRSARSVFAPLAAAAVGVGVTSFLSDTVSLASDAEQAVGGLRAVFGRYTRDAIRDSKRAADNLGLSATQYQTLLTVSGALLKNKGLEDFADQSANLVGIGADLAATFGGTTKDAVDALNAAMRGESDPIERYGISLNETAVNAVLAEKGLTDLEGAALDQAKAQARLQLITTQSADAQGAFARESDTLAGKQQRLSARFEDAKTELGQGLLPIVADATEFLSDRALPAFEDFARWFTREGIPAIKEFGDDLRPLAESLLPAMGTALETVRDVLGEAAPLAKDLVDGFNSLPDGLKQAVLIGAGVGALGLKGKNSLATGGLLSGLTKSKPLPVFVVNQGLGAGVSGGKPGKTGPGLLASTIKTSPYALPLLLGGDSAGLDRTEREIDILKRFEQARESLKQTLDVPGTGNLLSPMLADLLKTDAVSTINKIKLATDEAGITFNDFIELMPTVREALGQVDDRTRTFGLTMDNTYDLADTLTQGLVGLNGELDKTGKKNPRPTISVDASAAFSTIDAVQSALANIPLVGGTLGAAAEAAAGQRAPRGGVNIERVNVQAQDYADFMRQLQRRTRNASGGGVNFE